MMTSEMSDKVRVFLWLCLLGLSTAKLTLRGDWKEGFGWNVECSWETLPNDTLQSVRMYRNGYQFLVYRPEIHGRIHQEVSRSVQFMTTTKCEMSTLDGRRGVCVVNVEPRLNVTEDTYRCESSGERPTFRLEAQEYTVFAAPTTAIVNQNAPTETSPRPTVYCTSSGVPPPRLTWTVEGEKIPGDFTRTVWNATSKLWDSWSSYNPQKDQVAIVCTPEAVTKTGRTLRGVAAILAIGAEMTNGAPIITSDTAVGPLGIVLKIKV
ncbi:hypothetical protein NE865_08472 [Phthorimaea operculella]|nr:hypothetical protein NE865_08472 [Phthorimaea operculella]